MSVARCPAWTVLWRVLLLLVFLCVSQWHQGALAADSPQSLEADQQQDALVAPVFEQQQRIKADSGGSAGADSGQCGDGATCGAAGSGGSGTPAVADVPADADGAPDLLLVNLEQQQQQQPVSAGTDGPAESAVASAQPLPLEHSNTEGESATASTQDQPDVLPADAGDQQQAGEAEFVQEQQPAIPAAEHQAAAPEVQEAALHDEQQHNFALSKDGAKVLAANREAKKAQALLDDDSDTFIKNDCRADKWVIVELSQVAKVCRLELAQYELYSARVRQWEVWGRQSHPRVDGFGSEYARTLNSSQWKLLGNFTAEKAKGSQTFVVERPMWGRYLLLRFLSQHGPEPICAINGIAVFGKSAAEELEDQLASAAEEGLGLLQPDLAIAGTLDEDLQAGQPAAEGHPAGAEAGDTGAGDLAAGEAGAAQPEQLSQGEAAGPAPDDQTHRQQQQQHGNGAADDADVSQGTASHFEQGDVAASPPAAAAAETGAAVRSEPIPQPSSVTDSPPGVVGSTGSSAASNPASSGSTGLGSQQPSGMENSSNSQPAAAASGLQPDEGHRKAGRTNAEPPTASTVAGNGTAPDVAANATRTQPLQTTADGATSQGTAGAAGLATSGASAELDSASQPSQPQDQLQAPGAAPSSGKPASTTAQPVATPVAPAAAKLATPAAQPPASASPAAGAPPAGAPPPGTPAATAAAPSLTAALASSIPGLNLPLLGVGGKGKGGGSVYDILVQEIKAAKLQQKLLTRSMVELQRNTSQQYAELSSDVASLAATLSKMPADHNISDEELAARVDALVKAHLLGVSMQMLGLQAALAGAAKQQHALLCFLAMMGGVLALNATNFSKHWPRAKYAVLLLAAANGLVGVALQLQGVLARQAMWLQALPWPQ